jgi:MSHA biogenesis protein MshI
MLIMKIPFLSAFTKRSTRAETNFVVAISGNGVHFAQVKYVADRPQVVSYAFHQVTGIKSSGITPAVLEKMRNGLRVADFQFSTLLAPGEYQLLQVEAPNVPEGEMKAAVRWSIKDMLSYHVDDATLDILSIPANQAGGERKKSLYVVVASNELIKRRTELFERAHINLRVIDIPEMAQRNIAALYEHEGRALALLAFDENGGLLTFTSDGELYLARRIEISVGQLQDANESLRQQYFDRLELEVQRSIDHFDRQFKHLTLRRLMVCAPENVGLIQMLANGLDLPVERLDLSEVMDFSGAPDLASDEARVYALHALGAALRQEGRAL